MKDNRKHIGEKWGGEGHDPPRPFTVVDPKYFKEELLKHLGTDEETITRKFSAEAKKAPILEGEEFIKYERTLATIYKNETLAYHVARIAVYLSPEFQLYLKTMKEESVQWILRFLGV